MPRRIAGRIDLEHHLMPDPVGEAIAALVDRIEFLEMRLARLAGDREPSVDFEVMPARMTSMRPGAPPTPTAPAPPMPPQPKGAGHDRPSRPAISPTPWW